MTKHNLIIFSCIFFTLSYGQINNNPVFFQPDSSQANLVLGPAKLITTDSGKFVYSPVIGEINIYLLSDLSIYSKAIAEPNTKIVYDDSTSYSKSPRKLFYTRTDWTKTVTYLPQQKIFVYQTIFNKSYKSVNYDLVMFSLSIVYIFFVGLAFSHRESDGSGMMLSISSIVFLLLSLAIIEYYHLYPDNSTTTTITKSIIYGIPVIFNLIGVIFFPISKKIKT